MFSALSTRYWIRVLHKADTLEAELSSVPPRPLFRSLLLMLDVPQFLDRFEIVQRSHFIKRFRH